MPERLDLECVYARKRRRTRAALLQEAEAPTQSEDVPPASTLLNDHPYSPQPEPLVKLPSQTTSSVMKRYPPRKQAAAVHSKPVDPPSAPSAHSVSPRTHFSASEADLLSPRHEAHNATVGYLNPPIARSRTPMPVSDAQRRPVAGVYADDDPSEPLPPDFHTLGLRADDSCDGAAVLDRSRASLASVHAAPEPARWVAGPST